MAYVAINVLSVPPGAGGTLEERFAARQGAVDSAPGFEHFELLRPLEGTQDYLVYTRWSSEEAFRTWRSSQEFGQGHARASGRTEGRAPAATGSSIWAFEVAQHSDGAGISAPPAEPIAGIVTTDPGPRQEPGGGTAGVPPEDPDAPPLFG